MRRRTLWPVLAVGALLLAACGNDADPAAEPAADGDTAEPGDDDAAAADPDDEFLDASIAVVNNMLHLPVFVAQEFGLWVERGLNIDVRILGSGADIGAALGAGEVEFAVVNAATGVPPQRASGLLSQLVGMYNNDATNSRYVDWMQIIGRVDADVTEDPESLVGKSIGVTAGGTPAEYFAAWMEEEGFTADQFDVVTMQPPDMVTAIEAGEVDAVVPWEPFGTAVRSRLGDDVVVVSDGEPILLGALGLGAIEGAVDEQEDVFRRMIEGLVEATWLIRQDPEAVAPVVLGFVEGIDEQEAIDAMENNVYDPRVSVCTEYGVETTSEILVREGTVDQTFTADELMDTRLLDEVLDDNPDLIDDLPPLPESVEECEGFDG